MDDDKIDLQSLQSLVDSNQDKYDRKMQSNKYYYKKPKNIDFYQTLLSTNNQSHGIPQICQKGQFQIPSDQEIEFLQDTFQSKRKRGRPKKRDKKQTIQDQYKGNQEENQQQDFYTTLNKNRRQKKKRVVKGNTKNIFHFFCKVVVEYLRKRINQEQLKQIKISNPNRYIFQMLLKNPSYENELLSMFQTRYLNREVMLSKLTLKCKMLYLKKIQNYREIFNNSNRQSLLNQSSND